MVLAVLLLLAGAVVVTVGAEAAVHGASRLARARGLSPAVLGALLFGVDLEGLGTALLAAGRGQTSIAAGEAFGTILFLFSAAFGAALLLAPRPVRSPGPGMVLMPAGTLVAGALALADLSVTRAEGLALVGVYALYVLFVLGGRQAPAPILDQDPDGRRSPRLGPGVQALVGLGLVYLGASLLLGGGVRILERTALSAGFIGAAVVGTLASLDEVLLEVLPIRRGVPELATGNLFGTVAAFASGVLGAAALVRPLVVDSAAAFAYLAATVLYTIVAGVFLIRGEAGRTTGLAVLGVYGLWLALASGT